MRITVLAMICAGIAGSAAAASVPQAISPLDAQRYKAAFDAVDRGDFIEAQVETADISDPSLTGYITFGALMHPTAHKADYDELASWLNRFADLPGADRIYALATKRKPADAAPPRPPVLSSFSWSQIEQTAQRIASYLPGDKARSAREAFYAGDAQRALALAPKAGDGWIAGLAAYRLKNYALAEEHLQKMAQGEQDPWLRAGAAFWAARAAEQQGANDRALGYLRVAARDSNTFYGMIAARQISLATPSAAKVAQAPETAATGQWVLAAYTGPTVDLARFVATDARAHRAAALAQIGKLTEAGLELRAGLTLAASDPERQKWTALILSLNAPLTEQAWRVETDYPAPDLEPAAGFTIDKALVYAIVRQESRFNPAVVSSAGAVGLMQLMPEAAARAAGDDKLKADMTPLFDPAYNLRVGQDYVTWLMERGVGYDLLRTVAAYNGGPGTLLKTAKMLGDQESDSLMVIECLPSQETRNYVEKVVTAYWTYRGKFGEDTKTLDALASGAKFVDARLDR